MKISGLPDPLKKKVQELAESPSPLKSCIESGEYVCAAALFRAEALASAASSTKLSKTGILLLVPESSITDLCADTALCESIQGVCVQENDSPKENLRDLGKRSKVAVMTPSRAIDHLRRDNIDLSACSHVIVLHSFDTEETSEPSELDKQLFFDDCRFIFTKVPSDATIEIFCRETAELSRDPKVLTEEMRVIPISSWYRSPYPISYMTVKDHSPKRILDVLYALGQEEYTVILGGNTAKGALLDRLGKAPLPISCRVITCGEINTLHEQHGIEQVTVVPVGVSPDQLTEIITHLFTWKGKTHSIVTLLTALEAKQIAMRKETLFMDQEKKLAPSTEEITAGKLQLLTAKVKVDSNPEELEMLKKTFKKNVPFTQRTNVTAFLLREYLNSAAGTRKSAPKSAQKSEKASKAKKANAPSSSEKGQKARPAQNIPEGARTLYINIGKMRRLYARELSQVIQDTLAITREDIFSVRVHDKYSFVTLSQEHAEKAIELLNGKEIRGRVASVSYSNKE